MDDKIDAEGGRIIQKSPNDPISEFGQVDASFKKVDLKKNGFLS
jgi:hypothetical protein